MITRPQAPAANIVRDFLCQASLVTKERVLEVCTKLMTSSLLFYQFYDINIGGEQRIKRNLVNLNQEINKLHLENFRNFLDNEKTRLDLAATTLQLRGLTARYPIIHTGTTTSSHRYVTLCSPGTTSAVSESYLSCVNLVPRVHRIFVRNWSCVS